MENTEKKKVILCAIYPQGGEEAENVSLGELERLAETAGCEAAAIVTQCRERPDVKTVLGSGKIAELSELCGALGVDLIVFDCELSPSQIKSVEDAVGHDAAVIDRSMLILDIFADHARTSEGRLQVELAQLKYTSPRLIGRGKELSVRAARPRPVRSGREVPARRSSRSIGGGSANGSPPSRTSSSEWRRTAS